MQRFDSQHETPKPHGLPTLAELAPLLKLVADDNFDYQEFCAAVEQQTTIRNRILKAAQSASIGRGAEVAELRHAIAMIGIRRVRNILEVLQQRAIDQEPLQKAS